MKLAIMQPYFFPYIGYWQLVNAADRFVIYDDVKFIKRGWINRNRILINGAPQYITVPLDGASQNKRICDIAIHGAQPWQSKIVKSIEFAYGRSAFYSEIYPEIKRQICNDSHNLAEFLTAHLKGMAEFLRIDTEIVISSRAYRNSDLRGQERIIDICRREQANTYINLPGGRDFYDTGGFRAANIDLMFLSSRISPYRQSKVEFVPNLSVIDALMELGIDGVVERLGEFELEVTEPAVKESSMAD